jgi:acid phosphatase (class A)
MRLTTAAATACVLIAALPAQSMDQAPRASATAPPGTANSQTGYLDGARIPDVAKLLGAPPPDGSGTKMGDVATYRATRGLQGSPRWALAASDADYGPGPMLRDFSCVLGVSLDPATAPALAHLLGRLTVDSSNVERPVKAVYRRPRPFVELGGPICVAPDAYLTKSYSYPSGHSTYSWTVAQVLDEIAPDRAGAILARARAYGESRVVCGVHYESDVQAGRMAATALFGALQRDPVFSRDLEAARVELARLRSHPAAAPDKGRCDLEASAIDHPVW